MVCTIFSCAGVGWVSRLFSIVISIVLTCHTVGLISPHWMCDYPPGQNQCDLKGIYYHCYVDDCNRYVPDITVLALALIVFISCFTLNLVLCLLMNCSPYRFKEMSPWLSVCIGGWFLLQETINVALLILTSVKFDKVGWSAYVFMIPGVIAMVVIAVVVVYMVCFPASKTPKNEAV